MVDYEELIKESWSLTKKDLGIWIAATILGLFGSIFLITIGPLAYGYNNMAVKSLKSKDIRLKDLFVGFKLKNFFGSWIVIIISTLPYLLITFINSLLAYIVVFLFVYAMPLLVLRKYGGIAACKESTRIALNKPVETIIITIFYGFLINIGFLALLIGALITIPLGEIILTGAVFDLIGEKRTSRESIKDNVYSNEKDPYQSINE
jgi:hypothetical protein